MRFIKHYLPAFCAIAILLAGCKRDQLRWETQVKGPILTSSLDFNDLLIDTLFEENAEGSLDLVYRYEEKLDSFGDVLDVPDTLNEVSVTLQKLLLDDRNFVDTIPLSEIYPPSKIFDGQQAVLPAQNLSNVGSTDIDVTQEFFREAKFEKGFLDITIHNDLPVDVALIDFQLANKNDGSVIARDQFVDIPPFSSSSKSISLAGKLVEGTLIGEIIQLQSRASNGTVLIEADKGVRLELTVRDMEPEYATAIFPEQTLVDEDGETTYNFGGPQVTVMEIESGFVIMDIISTIDEEIILEYTIPQSELDDDPTKFVYKEVVVPPAPPGETVTIKDSFPIDKFKIFYKGKDLSAPPFTNTVYSKLSARIKYTGIERTLSLKDSVRIIYGLVDIVPKFAIGDFGQKTFNFDDKVDVNAFKEIKGNISLEDAEVIMGFENAFGIEAKININDITGVNTRTNNGVKLSSTFINDDILLSRALNPPLIPRIKQYKFDQGNSNVKQFIENMPDQINTDFGVVSRPNGSNDFTDFAYLKSYLKAFLDVKIPMKFNADNLVIQHKQPFDVNSIERLDQIKEGTFTLLVDNGFPFEVGFELAFLDANDSTLFQIFDNADVAAEGEIVDDKVVNKVRTEIKTTVSREDMQRLSQVKKVIVKGRLNTTDSQRYPIYDEYKIDVKLLADMIYEQAR